MESADTGPTGQMPAQAAAVLEFWIGALDDLGLADREHVQRWWQKSPEFDAQIRTRFGPLHTELQRSLPGDWLTSPRARLAAIVVLDQFSRNMFRDTPRMFAQDPLARTLANEGLERGDDRALRAHERFFFYMPFMHSELLADQERGVALFQSLAADAAELQGNVAYAIQHRDIVARFGRFPHRNQLLGRESTPEEVEFLKQPGSSF